MATETRPLVRSDDYEQSTNYSSSQSDSLEGGGEGFVTVDVNGDQGSDATDQAIKKCDKHVLRPYGWVLKTLGWIPWVDDGSLRQNLLRIFTVTFWTAVILLTSLMQILVCFARDRFSPGTPIDNSSRQEITCTDHLISTYIIIDIFLVVTYLLGLVIFYQNKEYLSNLATSLFVCNKDDAKSNDRLVNKMRIYFALGILWILLSFAVRIMTARTVRLFENGTTIRWGNALIEGGLKLFLIILSLIGFVFFDIVYVAAVMNYTAQSEIIIYWLYSVRTKVENKTYKQLDEAVKVIKHIQNSLKMMNGKTAALTALILYNLASAGIHAIITLDNISTINNEYRQYFNAPLAVITAILNASLWMGLVVFPFIQAARVTTECRNLKETGPLVRTRPFEYSRTPQLELDSYEAFTQAIELRASMFGIPIYSWFVYFVVVVFTFTMLVLFQTGTYSFYSYL